MKKVLLITFAVLCLGSFFSVDVLAQQKKRVKKQSNSTSLKALKNYAGEYANDKVLKNSVLRKLLVGLVGSSKLKTIEHYTTVAGPVDMISGDIVVSGCAPHQCSDKSAVVVAVLATNEVHAAIFENEEIVIYSKQKTYDYLPEGLKDWVTRTTQYQRDEIGIRVKVRYR
ncbi:MAG: hypothetical protein M3384_14370 [Acidobacteriota bacterium]|nr:hypothetical protein [Acidobacteriota bacterium]